MTPTPFNLAQLATYDQAKELAQRLSAGPIVVGGGVKPGTDEPLTPPGGSITFTPPLPSPGIYRPPWSQQPWSVEPHYFAPDGQKYYFLHLRFVNGAEGMNVGLMLDLFKRYPMSPMYVLRQLAEEADRIAHQQ